MDLQEIFLETFGDSKKNIYEFFSPGRVNLIGEHIDYNGGYVFPAAISLGISALAREREDNIVNIKSLSMNKEVSIEIGDWISFDEKDSWTNFPKGIIKFMHKEGLPVNGADILLSSTLPIESGLSSSASLEIILGYIFRFFDIKNDQIDRNYLAFLGKKVENDFIGLKSGIMDQFVIANGQKNHALLLNTENLDFEYIPFELEDYKLVVINSNKKRTLSDSKYNIRKEECEKALSEINKHKTLDNLCQASIEDLILIKDDILRNRARHVIEENKRVFDSVDFLKKNNILEFSKLLIKSHESLKNNYEVTGEELDFLVDTALNSKGCIGARMTGAGFGGCIIAIVDKNYVESFEIEVKLKYKNKTGIIADFYQVKIVDGVKLVQ